MHRDPWKHACATVQPLLCHGIIANSFEICILPKKPSKFTPAHDTVAAALLHKHHLIIHVGAGPIQLIHGSLLQLAADATVTPKRLHFRPCFGENFIFCGG